MGVAIIIIYFIDYNVIMPHCKHIIYAYVKAIDMYVHRTAKLEYNEPEHSEFTAL